MNFIYELKIQGQKTERLQEQGQSPFSFHLCSFKSLKKIAKVSIPYHYLQKTGKFLKKQSVIVIKTTVIGFAELALAGRRLRAGLAKPISSHIVRLLCRSFFAPRNDGALVLPRLLGRYPPPAGVVEDRGWK
ncbi:MAG: hypothetical protein LBU92_02330 [Prevotellaceae bacterium]|nr:hypothetical protein [Prevotellaceae bacterium]